VTPIVMDTGVLVAGIFWRSEPHKCVKAWLLGMVSLIVSEIPEYGGSLTSTTFWDGIQLGCEQSLRQFTSLLGRRVGLDSRARSMVRALGQYESRSGRTLDSLQLAYRMGERLSWRTMAKVAHEEQLDAEEDAHRVLAGHHGDEAEAEEDGRDGQVVDELDFHG